MDTNLPIFIYHPNPLQTGSILASPNTCLVCGRARGYIYNGPNNADVELNEQLCPWCIADGSAHARFNASFTDESGVGNYGAWDAVPQEVIEIVAYRTPGFFGWQQERWWTHCGDAGMYLGRFGYQDLLRFGQQALDAIANESGYTDNDLVVYLRALHSQGSPTAYLFQCRRCAAYGGYSDAD